MLRHSNDRARHYHGCGRLKYDFMMKYGVLPAFTNGSLYVSRVKGTAYEYALDGGGFLDDVIIRIQAELNLPEVSGMEPFDLAVQLRSIIESIRNRKSLSPESIIESGITYSALAGYFPISSKEFRRAFLRAREEISTYGGLIITLGLEGERVYPNTFPCEATDYGVRIPLVGDDKTQGAVSVKVASFVNQSGAYKKIPKEIPALNIERKILDVEFLGNYDEISPL